MFLWGIVLPCFFFICPITPEFAHIGISCFYCFYRVAFMVKGFLSQEVSLSVGLAGSFRLVLSWMLQLHFPVFPSTAAEFLNASSPAAISLLSGLCHFPSIFLYIFPLSFNSVFQYAQPFLEKVLFIFS